ncbi:MAG TPA: zf-HC2 domain-containing protein, partial [Gemmatimonadaceae bacterium]|nr:zf-HC2 domain-containing protein [Gemmatimonadaceae bacterium]
GGGDCDCRTAMRQLWDYLDQELTPERMEAMQRHLEKCAGCYPHLDFERAFLDALSGCKETRCAPERLKAKILGKLREAGFSAAS